MRLRAAFFVVLVFTLFPQAASAQRGGEVTVTITPSPEIKVEAAAYVASGAHQLHFNNTTSRDAKVLSMELLFIEEAPNSKSCDLFFGNVIGAAVRRYDLKDVVVLSAKAANATTKMLPPDENSIRKIETEPIYIVDTTDP